jgi:hypothetical protein
MKSNKMVDELGLGTIIAGLRTRESPSNPVPLGIT